MALDNYQLAQQQQYLNAYSNYANQQAAMSRQQMQQNMLNNVAQCAVYCGIGMALAHPEYIVMIGSQLDPAHESPVKYKCTYPPTRIRRSWLSRLLNRIF